MAAVKSKLDDNSKKLCSSKCDVINLAEVHSFRIFDVCLIILSMATFLVDLSTDAVLVVEYLKAGHLSWAAVTLFLIFVPTIITQVFSMRWHISDEITSKWHWAAHICLLGLIQRYILALRTGFEARSSGDPVDFQRLHYQQNDICMLHLFESFMESAPQLVLQLYIMVTLEDWRSWTGISAIASLVSLAWALAAYTRALRRTRPDKNCISWPGLILQAAWQGSMVTARIISLVLFAVVFHSWIFVFIGIHWICMTAWIIFQKTDFCQSPWEERIYNFVVGVIYCFCFFNLKEGQSRNRAVIFYTVVILQNVTCLSMFIAFVGMIKQGLVPFAITFIVAGTLLGLTSMLLYYRFFHPAGPITLFKKPSNKDVECVTPHQKSDGNVEHTATIRSLKHCWDSYKEPSDERVIDPTSPDGLPHSDDGCADKKSLLTHWISYQTSTPSDILQSDDELCVHHESDCDPRVVDVETDGNIIKKKRRGICSPEELGFELQQHCIDEIVQNSLDENNFPSHLNKQDCTKQSHIKFTGDYNSLFCNISDSLQIDNINKEKRRAICSSVDLEYDLEKSSDLHMDENNQDRHLVIAQFGENDNCHDYPLNFDSQKRTENRGIINQFIKQEEIPITCNEDTPSEVLSVPSEVLSAHDYENICAVNIAREAWGLRSWRGYSDIETWLHDDSVVRDRRRDTLTSTVTTITSASSENSTNSGEQINNIIGPPPIPCRRPRIQRSRQDDYLDTLADDLADCESRQSLAEFIAERDSEPNIFVARPYVVDQHGILYPLSTLDTIMEELEESSTDNGEIVKRQRHDSASTLVATIDEIRRGNSLCNLYNSSWDSRSTSSSNAQDSPCKAVSPLHSYYSTSLPSIPKSLVSTTHSRSHLSHEEVLFLSKLQPMSENEMSLIDETSVEQKQGSEVILDAKLYLQERSKSDLIKSPQLDINKETARKTGNKIRRKFSLLRERFELAQSDGGDSNGIQCIHCHGIQSCECDVTYDQKPQDKIEVSVKDENIGKTSISPVVTCRIKQWNSILKLQDPDLKVEESTDEVMTNIENSSDKLTKTNLINLKERRSAFLKQALSPTKFPNKNKKSSISFTNSKGVCAS